MTVHTRVENPGTPQMIPDMHEMPIRQAVCVALRSRSFGIGLVHYVVSDSLSHALIVVYLQNVYRAYPITLAAPFAKIAC